MVLTWSASDEELGGIHRHCFRCFNLKKCNKDGDACGVSECPVGCGRVYHSCKKEEHLLLCPMARVECINSSLGCNMMMARGDVGKHLPVCPASIVTCSQPKPPPPPPDLSSTMRFDIKMEVVTKLQQKPRRMYTFMCGQELRRDQWEGHCKNVHSDMNNWVEARCPLASYGCSFSSRRLYPGEDPATKVVYSQDTMSFGIRPPPVQLLRRAHPGKSLTDLPVELLQVIISFLDSWSLANLALVNTLLRDIAYSLLYEKGCVALQWEKVNTQGVGAKGWVVGYKRWFFNNYFCPVNHWGLNADADGKVSEHLKTCPFNIKTEHKKALDVKMKMKEWFIAMNY